VPDTPEDLPVEEQQLFIELWSWRLQDPTMDDSELASFALWFASGKLDPQWSLEQLQFVLNRVKRLRPAMGILERLAVYGRQHAVLVAQCFHLLATEDAEHSYLFDEAAVREVMTAIEESGDSEAIKILVQTIHELGLRGKLVYRELLPRLESCATL
jgi:hypothetical protein